MTSPQLLFFGILAATMALFLSGRLRHDVVALAALMACILSGLVSSEEAFAGFGHPAVITVACVLVLSQGLQNTGAMDWLARGALPPEAGRLPSLVALMGLGASMSGFMNNVGAMALLMPVAVRLSGRLGLTPGQVLMPLAFCTLLGGMTTLVGTPPNLIVSGFRDEAGLGHFAMFDFAPVGVAVAAAGTLFVAAIGWRLVPARKSLSGGGFDTGSYLTEVRITEKSKAVGLSLRDFERALEPSGAQVVGLVRNEVHMFAPRGGRRLQPNDILVLEADVDAVAKTLSVFGLRLEQQGSSFPDAPPGTRAPDSSPDTISAEVLSGGDEDRNEARGRAAREDDILLCEFVVLPGANIVGRTARQLHLRSRYGLNLLAVSRHGTPPRERLGSLPLKSGDLLLMQGPAEVMADFINDAGCVPLAERELRIPQRRMAIIAGAILLGTVGIVTLGWLPAAPAFMLGVLLSMLLRTVPPRQVYSAIDWPVIVLLAALIPVAGAMQTTGAADRLAEVLVDVIAQGNPIAALGVVLVTTMFLSDVMNNSATAAVMCPVAIGIAENLGVSPDSFLMAVAIGASCAFLTPIGHQNNTLILGPGGFRFGDYWRLGLPLEGLVVGVSIPLLLIVWPL